jgi:hypothetical protein
VVFGVHSEVAEHSGVQSERNVVDNWAALAQTRFRGTPCIAATRAALLSCADCRAGSARGAPTRSAVAPVAGSEVRIAKLCGYEFAVPVAACRHGGVFVD